jgi:hypothetical protein
LEQHSATYAFETHESTRVEILIGIVQADLKKHPGDSVEMKYKQQQAVLVIQKF